MSRLVAGVLIAPLAVAPVMTALFGPWAWSGGGLGTLAAIVFQALVVTYPAMLLFGVPIHATLSHQRCRSLRHYLTAGLLAGGFPIIAYCVVAIVVEAQFDVDSMWSAMRRNFTWGVIGTTVFGSCSAAVAAALWWITVRQPSAAASPSQSH